MNKNIPSLTFLYIINIIQKNKKYVQNQTQNMTHKNTQNIWQTLIKLTLFNYKSSFQNDFKNTKKV